MNEHELTAAEAVKDFLKSELSDFSYFKGWKIIETEYYSNEVYVDVDIRDTTVRFKVEIGEGNPDDCNLFVELGEDCWNEICTYNWKVKYFWMALLDWDRV